MQKEGARANVREDVYDYTNVVIVKKKLFFGNKIIFIPSFVFCEEHTHTKNGRKRERERERKRALFLSSRVSFLLSKFSSLFFFFFFSFFNTLN